MRPENCQAIVRSEGMCGDLAPDGSRVCILDPGHDEAHPWERPASLLDHTEAALESAEVLIGRIAHILQPQADETLTDRARALMAEREALLAVARAAQALKEWDDKGGFPGNTRHDDAVVDRLRDALARLNQDTT